MGSETRCGFLVEHDAAKLVTALCNYFSLGHAELGRALLRILAGRDVRKAVRILKVLILHGPPRHWLPSTATPSSAHLSWFSLIEHRRLSLAGVTKTSGATSYPAGKSYAACEKPGGIREGCASGEGLLSGAHVIYPGGSLSAPRGQDGRGTPFAAASGTAHCQHDSGLMERRSGEKAPPRMKVGLRGRLEFDLLLAWSLLDAATFTSGEAAGERAQRGQQKQHNQHGPRAQGPSEPLFTVARLSAEVANELRAYQAGLGLVGVTGGVTSGVTKDGQNASVVKLPAVSVLPVASQLAPAASFLPAQTIDFGELRAKRKQAPRLSRQAISELFQFTRAQPVLGHVLHGFLHEV